MAVTDVRLTASRVLDGISINKDKFARDRLTLFDANDRLQVAFSALQHRTAALELELKSLKSAKTSAPHGMPSEFNAIFGGVFGSKQ